MSISDDYESIDPKVVQIDRDARQRTEIDTSDLELSVAKHGILNPIIITRVGQLKKEMCTGYNDVFTSKDNYNIHV